MNDKELPDLVKQLEEMYMSTTGRNVWTDVYDDTIVNPWKQNTISASSFTTPNSHTIQGKAVIAQFTQTEAERDSLVNSSKGVLDEVKHRLATMLVEQMLKDKCIEFTSQQNMYDGTYDYRARIYVTPDSTVRILRELGQFNP